MVKMQERFVLMITSAKELQILNYAKCAKMCFLCEHKKSALQLWVTLYKQLFICRLHQIYLVMLCYFMCYLCLFTNVSTCRHKSSFLSFSVKHRTIKAVPKFPCVLRVIPFNLQLSIKNTEGAFF